MGVYETREMEGGVRLWPVGKKSRKKGDQLETAKARAIKKLE